MHHHWKPFKHYLHRHKPKHPERRRFRSRNQKETTQRLRFARRCLSESDLPTTSQNREIQDQIRQIVWEFFNRRRQCGRRGRSLSHSSDAPGNFSNELEHVPRRRRHAKKVRSRSTSSNSSSSSSSDSEGKEMKNRRKWHHIHSKRGGHEGRSTDQEEPATSINEENTELPSECVNKRCMKKKMKQEHKLRKYYFKCWKKHGFRHANGVDAFTMTEAIIENPDQENHSNKNIQEACHSLTSPEVQEVADNLERSTLE